MQFDLMIPFVGIECREVFASGRNRSDDFPWRALRVLRPLDVFVQHPEIDAETDASVLLWCDDYRVKPVTFFAWWNCFDETHAELKFDFFLEFFHAWLRHRPRRAFVERGCSIFEFDGVVTSGHGGNLCVVEHVRKFVRDLVQFRSLT